MVTLSVKSMGLNNATLRNYLLKLALNGSSIHY